MGAKFSLPYCVIFLYHIYVYTYVYVCVCVCLTLKLCVLYIFALFLHFQFTFLVFTVCCPNTLFTHFILCSIPTGATLFSTPNIEGSGKKRLVSSAVRAKYACVCIFTSYLFVYYALLQVCVCVYATS